MSRTLCALYDKAMRIYIPVFFRLLYKSASCLKAWKINAQRQED